MRFSVDSEEFCRFEPPYYRWTHWAPLTLQHKCFDAMLPVSYTLRSIQIQYLPYSRSSYKRLARNFIQKFEVKCFMLFQHVRIAINFNWLEISQFSQCLHFSLSVFILKNMNTTENTNSPAKISLSARFWYSIWVIFCWMNYK